MSYYLEVFPDEEQLKASSGLEDTSIEGMVEHEAGWIAQSGIGTGSCLQLPTDDDQPLVDEVIERIKKDIQEGDLTAVDELLKFVPVEYLKGYLPEK